MQSDRKPLPPPNSQAQVPKERTGWRDLHLSERHRKWGIACPAQDIDFLLLEFDRGRATAIFEYKAEHAPAQLPSHPSYRALVDLGDRADLPVFAVRYAQDFTWWKVVALNKTAKRILPERKHYDERQFVTLLYNLRGLNPPEEIFNLLETAI